MKAISLNRTKENNIVTVDIRFIFTEEEIDAVRTLGGDDRDTDLMAQWVADSVEASMDEVQNGAREVKS